MRLLFEIARAHEPCVVFIDEIDSLGGWVGVWEESALEQGGGMCELLIISALPAALLVAARAVTQP